MQKQDEIRLTADQQPSVMEYLQQSGVKPGDKCEMVFHLTLKQQDPEGADFIVEAAVPEGYEMDDEQEQVPNNESMTALNPDVTMSPAAMLVRKIPAKPPYRPDVK